MVLAVFTAAVFTSALLLFAVQPMFTRMVLPRLGGSPSVWSVAMVFFQTMLLAGYAYAHILMRMLRPPTFEYQSSQAKAGGDEGAGSMAGLSPLRPCPGSRPRG